MSYNIFQLEETIELAKLIESTGVSALAVHGRTKQERPRHTNREDYIKAVAEAVNIPVIAKWVFYNLIEKSFFASLILHTFWIYKKVIMNIRLLKFDS